jgi:DNA-binding NtrC family response regulator
MMGREPRTLPELVASYERVVIIEALSRAEGSRTRAAALLGVTRAHLYRRVWALHINLGEISVALGRPRKSPTTHRSSF